MEKYDLCVIGCGPAGFAGAMRALDLGKNVCIIERDQIGGAGVLWGALASKSLWELSKDYAGAARVDRGYRSAGLQVDFEEVRKTVLAGVKEKQHQMLSQIESYHPSKNKKGSIVLKRGEGRFVDKNTIDICDIVGECERIYADKILIATGSRPREFPGIPFDRQVVLSSDTILNLKKFPRRILIVGAGIIGCEFASIFSNFGQSEVYLLDHAHKILPFEDDDISDFIDANLTKGGVTIFHKAKLKEARKTKEAEEVVIDFADGHCRVLEVDAILMAIGRVPNTDKLQLENANLKLSDRGYLEGEDNVKITEDIFAAGDITPGAALVNIGEMKARHAVKFIYGAEREAPSYDHMPTIMFFKPEVAAVGLNEKQCQEKGIAYKVAWYSNALVNRAISMRATSGFVKLLMAMDGSDRILGMRAAGPQASSLVVCITMLMDQNRKVQDINKTIHPHPSMTEGIQEAIRLLLDKPIYKPDVFPDHMRVSTWSPEN